MQMHNLHVLWAIKWQKKNNKNTDKGKVIKVQRKIEPSTLPTLNPPTTLNVRSVSDISLHLDSFRAWHCPCILLRTGTSRILVYSHMLCFQHSHDRIVYIHPHLKWRRGDWWWPHLKKKSYNVWLKLAIPLAEGRRMVRSALWKKYSARDSNHDS